MTEDHTKTVVMDSPPKRHADDDAHKEPQAERSVESDSIEPKPAMPSSWLS